MGSVGAPTRMPSLTSRRMITSTLSCRTNHQKGAERKKSWNKREANKGRGRNGMHGLRGKEEYVYEAGRGRFYVTDLHGGAGAQTGA